MRKLARLLVSALLVVANPAHAQVPDRPDSDHHQMAGERLGEIAFSNSGNVAAQAPFLRGVKLLHNIEYPQAWAHAPGSRSKGQDRAGEAKWHASPSPMAG